MSTRYKILILLLYLLPVTFKGNIQVKAQTLRHYFDDAETRYIGFAASGQFWARHSSLNPGSLVGGNLQSDAWDLSVRRYRMKLYGQWSPKTEFVLTLGNNNISQVNKNGGSPKLLDAYATFNWKKSLSFGAGKKCLDRFIQICGTFHQQRVRH